MSRSIAICLVMLAPSQARAGTFRLSEGQGFSHVSLPRISPNGHWAIYPSDAETQGAYELWRVPVEGGEPSRLSGLLLPGYAAFPFTISPNSTHVAYIAIEDDLDHREAFAAPIAALPGSAVKLNDPLATGGNVLTVEFSPNSARVVFSVQYEENEEVRNLWSATPDGGDLDLLVTVPAPRGIRHWQITPNSQYVLYTADAANGARELWRVPLSGGGSTRLTTDIPPGGEIIEFDVSPDSSIVVYSTNRDAIDQWELFQLPVAGGTPDQISNELGMTHQVRGPTFAPNGSRVVYTLWAPPSPNELWSVEPDGDGNVELSGLQVPGGGLELLGAFQISPISNRVVYRAEQQSVGVQELYSVPLAGGADVKLNGPLVDGGDVLRFRITSDGARVAYTGDQEVDGRVDLYSAPIAGGGSVRLSQAPPLTSVDVEAFEIATGGAGVFYVLSSESLAGYSRHFYSVPIAGGPIHRIDETATGGEEYVEPELFALSPVDPKVLVYAATFELPDFHSDLYYGDTCIFCNGFEGSWRWDSPEP
jgi:Tol biopolymer transport system component